MKTCIACGMPMEKITDFTANDPNKDYCVHCVNCPPGKSILLRRRLFIA
ncbi:MAG: hypothetical protein GX351_02140 [Peptococcaceae bacterium]|nr:hypothetical protein [Peptococcaceae bacterium]